MSLAARITTPDDFSARDGESHETASPNSNAPIFNRRMWSDRRDRHSRCGLLREPGDHGNQWRPLGG